MKFYKQIAVLSVLIFLTNIFLSINVNACKDMIACGDATGGDYNLLLKVRDPSRPGPNVLNIVPEGHEYTYHHPWNGKPMEFKIKHKFIQVTSEGDTIPNIIKPAMAISQTGIAYGDADSNSKWQNPSKYAWDDFDWIRYACQEADDEDEAVELMTKDVVDKLHASYVSENLFVVGPEKGFVIEADVNNYKIKEIINGFEIYSNYPNLLWRTQIRKCLPIASSFDITKEEYIRKGRTIRLNSLYGVRIKDIVNNQIVAQQVPFFKISDKKITIIGKPVIIEIGERQSVGDFSVELIDINGKQAKIRICNIYKAWEDSMIEHIKLRYGSIDVNDMIYWSRLHSDDLKGLRSMCGTAKYECAAIFKIPKNNYELMSSGWFAPNKPCTSIYVPFHICNNDIYDPYKSSQAAIMSLNLLEAYGHDFLNEYFTRVETVFLNENEIAEKIAADFINNNPKIADYLTIIDTNMQKQAFLTEELWLEASKIEDNENRQSIIDFIEDIWFQNYTDSIKRMRTILPNINKIEGSNFFSEKIEDISINICKFKLDAASSIGMQSMSAKENFDVAEKLINKKDYEQGFELLEKSIKENDLMMKGELLPEPDSSQEQYDITPTVGFSLIFVLIIIFLVILLKRKQS